MKRYKNFVLFVSLAVLIVLAVSFGLFPLLKLQQVAQPDYFPTQGWKTSKPEEQGWDSAKLAEGLLAMREQKSISTVCS